MVKLGGSIFRKTAGASCLSYSRVCGIEYRTSPKSFERFIGFGFRLVRRA
jgi:hypothetical protein